MKSAHCSNLRGIALLPTTYKNVSNILVSELRPYVDAIIVDYQYVFRRNKLLIKYFVFVRYWGKSGSIMEQYISYL